jgi:serine/threonine-protein phosphatase 2A regulatory subunit B
MEAKPVHIIPVHEAVKPKLCDLYENDIIFDKFEVSFNHDGTSVMTGSYSNYLRMSPTTPGTGEGEVIHADKSIFRKKNGRPRVPGQVLLDGPAASRPIDIAAAASLGDLEFTKRIFTATAHPRENTVAIASSCNLFIFSQK